MKSSTSRLSQGVFRIIPSSIYILFFAHFEVGMWPFRWKQHLPVKQQPATEALQISALSDDLSSPSTKLLTQ